MALLEELENQGNWLFRYRSKLPLIILFIGAVLYLRKEVYPETFFLEDGSYEIYYERICLLVCFIGLAIRIYTVGYTPKDTSGRNTEEQLAGNLNTTGIYSIVRHPLYLGNFFMWLGVGMLTGNFWFVTIFILFYWIYYERIMFAEEQFLRKKFGITYVQWAEKTPPFVPNLSFKNYIKPANKFNWRKILSKEKNGLAAIFIIFCFFDIAGKLITNRKDFDYLILSLCIITGILYLILKYIKYNTNIFNEHST